MSATRRIFISDVHIGLRGQAKWLKRQWFQNRHVNNLVCLLDEIATQGDSIKDLVLLGDFFETWMAPVDIVPPTIEDVLKYQGNQKIFKTLRKCVKNLTNVFYLNGNHDMHVGSDDIAKLAVNGKKIRHIPRYQSGLLYAEHGSRFAMFNARDKLHDPLDGYPLGYFITRILATTDEKYDRPGSILSYVDDLLEAAFTTTTLASSVIEALMELASLTPDTNILMPPPRPALRVRDVQRKYAYLWDRWVEKFGYRYALQTVLGEMDSLEWFGDRLCKKQGYRVVVLGHTHNAKIDKDWLFTPDRAYANAGYWCNEEPTYIEVDKKRDEFVVKLVTIKGIVDGKLQKEEKKEVVTI